MRFTNTVLRSLLMMSLLTLLFVGATFAWFTDGISNEGNRIQAGNLKITLEAASSLEGEYRNLASSTEPIFDFGTNVEPGVEPIVAYLKITNTGSIPLRYRLNFDVLESGLEDAVVFTIEKIGLEDSTQTLTGQTLPQTFLERESMLSSEVDVYRIEMSLDADNSVNLDSDDPRFPLAFLFDVHLMAWQLDGPNPFNPPLSHTLPWLKEDDLR